MACSKLLIFKLQNWIMDEDERGEIDDEVGEFGESPIFLAGELSERVWDEVLVSEGQSILQTT